MREREGRKEETHSDLYASEKINSFLFPLQYIFLSLSSSQYTRKCIFSFYNLNYQEVIKTRVK